MKTWKGSVVVQFRKSRRSPWVVQIRDEKGGVKTLSFEKKSDALECEALLRLTRKRIQAGLAKPQSKMIFFDFAADFMKKRTLSHPASTWTQDESKLRLTWLPLLGNRLISSITRLDIEEPLDMLLSDGVGRNAVSSATRNRHRALLHTLFEAAIDAQIISENPVARIPVLSEKIKSRKVVVWDSLQDVETYLTQAKEEGEVYFVWASLQFWAGPRISQSLAVQWREILFDEHTIIFRRIFERVSGEILERTKGQGEGGEYIAPLFPRLEAVLKRWKTSNRFNSPNDFVLTDQMGRHLTYNHLENVNDRIIKRTGLKRITIHGMRHVFATNAKKAGFSKQEIQEMLGHENIRTTEGYTHDDSKHLFERARQLRFGETLQ